ncbi:hypothetical protein [Aminipila luticellarii]|uniref:Uncharacterized protein n=1 Tax=Aminipila luticellarii TaxID=2507160 RepID=A0A410PTR5_9FIRM|nr:hypothetical protein [Aminipila luticellarii]QAT42361.1 hypothetical protein EQM06_03440 [Aminipila luticellarii]
MKKPLNYAMLLHFTKVDEACADDVIESLKGDYSNYKGLKRDAMIEAIMTAEANGILEESRFEMDSTGKLRVYYRATGEMRDIILKAIG